MIREGRGKGCLEIERGVTCDSSMIYLPQITQQKTAIRKEIIQKPSTEGG
jgi:hypothetical protein